jgi:lipid II:glycine glycyltransferase (peptidoglycan interpeptide bridge formation enzyme)
MQLWRVGWSGKHDGCDPNDVLHWEMIKWAKENGFQQFDFLHIRPDHARAILRGEKVKDSYSGVTDYKLAFGGQLRVLPELYYFSFQPAVQMALESVGERFIKTDRGPKLLNKTLGSGSVGNWRWNQTFRS